MSDERDWCIGYVGSWGVSLCGVTQRVAEWYAQDLINMVQKAVSSDLAPKAITVRMPMRAADISPSDIVAAGSRTFPTATFYLPYDWRHKENIAVLVIDPQGLLPQIDEYLRGRG